MRSVLPFQNKTLQINSVEDISALGKKKQINKLVQKSDNGIKSWQLVKSVVTTVSKPSLTSLIFLSGFMIKGGEQLQSICAAALPPGSSEHSSSLTRDRHSWAQEDPHSCWRAMLRFPTQTRNAFMQQKLKPVHRCKGFTPGFEMRTVTLAKS